jgi:hypothetical protein
VPIFTKRLPGNFRWDYDPPQSQIDAFIAYLQKGTPELRNEFKIIFNCVRTTQSLANAATKFGMTDTSFQRKLRRDYENLNYSLLHRPIVINALINANLVDPEPVAHATMEIQAATTSPSISSAEIQQPAQSRKRICVLHAPITIRGNVSFFVTGKRSHTQQAFAPQPVATQLDISQEHASKRQKSEPPISLYKELGFFDSPEDKNEKNPSDFLESYYQNNFISK